METVIIHGQNHKGSTYHIASNLALKVGGNIKEFFLPKDFGEFCTGCTKCFLESEKQCPHFDRLNPITETIDKADLIILASPVYVMHPTGSMKAFLDHYGYRWMVHRPEETMFSKQGVCISTAAGGGMKSANKDMADSLFFWGVAEIYTYGKAVQAVKWQDVSEKNKKSIDKALSSLAKKITDKYGKAKPGIKTKLMFNIIRLLQNKIRNRTDTDYWQEKGWRDKNRPWK